MYSCSRFEPNPKRFCIYRIVEWILCTICVVFSLLNLLGAQLIPAFSTHVISVASFGYWFITLFDIILMSSYKSMTTFTWALFAGFACLLFALCTGLIIYAWVLIAAINFSILLIVQMFVVYLITCIVFLIDICIVVWSLTMEPDKSEPCEKPPVTCIMDFQPTSIPPCTIHACPGVIDEEGSQFPSDETLLSSVCTKHTCQKRQLPMAMVCTHGGTFHMSKDSAPVLDTPAKNPYSRSNPSTRAHTPRENVTNADSESTVEKTVTNKLSGAGMARALQLQKDASAYYVTVRNEAYNKQIEANGTNKQSTQLLAKSKSVGKISKHNPEKGDALDSPDQDSELTNPLESHSQIPDRGDAFS